MELTALSDRELIMSLENHSSRMAYASGVDGRIFTVVHDRPALNRVLFAANSTRDSVVIEWGWLDYKVKSSAGGGTGRTRTSLASECRLGKSFFSLFRSFPTNAGYSNRSTKNDDILGLYSRTIRETSQRDNFEEFRKSSSARNLLALL